MREVISIPGLVSHKCSVCAKFEPWSDEWTWYGSYKELEDGKPILKFCSDDCKQAAIARQWVPDDEEEAA